MKPKAYIGITGFRSVDEVTHFGYDLYANGFLDEAAQYQFMFGFISSANKLADKEKEGKESPSADLLRDLTGLVHRGGALPMLHYFTDKPFNLAHEVHELFTFSNIYADNHCQALQINGFDWPVLGQVEQIKEYFPNMKIVLQLPRQVLSAATPEQIIQRAKEYASFVDYCLIDPSGGEGKDFNVEYSANLMSGLDEVMPNTRMGVAGGLGPENVNEKISEVLDLYKKPFCVDAQGKLRSSDKRSIDLRKAENYLYGASMALDEVFFKE